MYLLFTWESESRPVVSDSLQPRGLYSPWNSPGQNTGVGSRSLLQGTFPTQGSNPGLPHCRQILYQLNHKGSPRILEWIAYPFSRASSQHRNQTLGSPALQANSSPTELSGGKVYYTVHGILQARILEWVAFAFSRGSFQPRDQT